MPKLMCNSCEVEYRPLNNDVRVLRVQSNGDAIDVYSADKWECPKCGNIVTTGFAHEPIIQNYQQGFQDYLDHIEYSILRPV